MKPMKKWIKVVLDAVLLAGLVLMYRKQALGLSFHEIGGLALIGLFLIHHVFNGKWIKAVTGKLFRKATPTRTRVLYLLDVLLAIAFLLIGVSGALISKQVFHFDVHRGQWKTLHYFCSAVALVLSGVHIGLHASYLFGFLKKRKALKIAACALLALICAYGVFSMARTSFFGWLAQPFAAEAEGEMYAGAPDAALGKGQGGPGKGLGKGQGNRQDGGEPFDAAPAGEHGGGGSLIGALTTAIQFASIASVFAAATGGIDALLRRRKAKAAA